MPKALLPTPMVEESVVRPCIIEVAKQIIDATMGPTDLKIVYKGQQETILQPGSSLNENHNNNTELSTKNTLFIESTEKYDEIYAGQLAAFQTEQVAMFMDDDLGVVIRPNYVPKAIELSFTLRHESKTHLNAWRDSIYLHINRLRSVYLHTLTYHYSLPAPMIKILKQIHGMREAVAGYGDTWEEWFDKCMTDRATVIANMVGENAQWAVRERQRRIQGMFDFTDAPPVPDKTDTSVWTTTFNYSFTMDVPVSLSMKYPVQVHNQLLPDEYLPRNTQNDEDYLKSYSKSLTMFSFFEAPRELNRLTTHRPNAIVLPDVDDFRPDSKPGSQFTILQVLVQLEEDRKYLFNLQELGDVELNPDMIKFLLDPNLKEWEKLPQLYQSIFYIHRYEFGSVKGNDNPIILDKDLNIAMTEALDPRINHRIRLALNTDITAINPAAIKRLTRHPKALQAWGKAVSLTWPQILWHTPRVDLRPFFPHLKPKHDRPTRYNVHLEQTQFNTVQTSFVIALRLDKIKDTEKWLTDAYVRKHIPTP